MEVDRFLAEFPELSNAETVFVACSGGLDSVVLTHMLHQLNLPLALVHVNYQLRGEDSMADEKSVQVLAKKLNCQFHLHRVDLNQMLKEKGGNLQATARTVRYQFFDDLLDAHQNAFFCTAHHADDQAETFLMRLLRQAGISGLSGIPNRRGKYIRPLLSFRKCQLKDYATNNQINWREDRSNQQSNYLRNLLRNEWIPTIDTQIVSAQMNFTEAVQILTGAFRQTKIEHQESVKPLITSIQQNGRFSIDQFVNLTADEQHAFLDIMDWSHELVSQIRASVNLERSKKISITSDTFLVREAHELVVHTEKVTKDPSLQLEEINALPEHFDRKVIYLDGAQLKGQLKLRKWEAGDRIEPLGMKGSQLVSDILKDAKVPIYEKPNCLVLTDDETILWVVHHKIGRHKIAQKESAPIIKVTIV